MANTELIWDLVDAKREPFIALADRVWAMPELCYTEHRSVAEHRAALARAGFPHHRHRRRHPNRRDGRGGRRWAGHRDPGRVRCPAGSQSGCGRALPLPGRTRGARARLRSQPPGIGLAARRDGGQGLPGRAGHQGPGPVLRLPGRGGGCRERLHGPGRGFRRCRHRDLLASGALLGRQRRGVARQHPDRLQLHGQIGARGRGAASRAQRARCGRADECRRELYARAHAGRRARPLRHSGRRRHRPECRAGLRQGPLSDPGGRPDRAAAARRASPQDRRRGRR